jgi:HPt (histidine-containing phosphotransfer) domain-containing protein
MERIDVQRIQILKSLGEDDPTFFPNLIKKFLDDTAHSIKKLATEVAANDSENAVATAHKLKGSASNLGATLFASLCKSIQDEAHEKRFDVAHQTVEKLRQELEGLASELSKL